MNCQNCGGGLEAGAKFCTHCGSPAASAPQPEPPSQPEPISEPGKDSAQPPVQGSYQPPVQQSYQPPAQPAAGAYQSPEQQGYPSQGAYQPNSSQGNYIPPQGGYTPPHGGYTPQGGYPPAQTAVKETKPVNKGLLFGGIGLGLVILAAILFLALRGGREDAYVGVWTVTNVSMFGMEVPAEESFADGFVLELKDGGAMSMNVGGEKLAGRWEKTKNGVKITADGMFTACEIDGDTMVIPDYFDTGMGITLKKGGRAGSSGGPSKPTGKPDSTPKPDGGYEDDVAGLTAAQAKWNGLWYGYMWIPEGFGYWSHVHDDLWDIFMEVDIDEDGYGTLSIYLDDMNTASSIDAEIYADEGHIEVISGWFWDIELDSDIWWLSPSSGSGPGTLLVVYDLYLDPELTDADGFEYAIYLRPYGEFWNWEEENGDLLPPSYYDYEEALLDRLVRLPEVE